MDSELISQIVLPVGTFVLGVLVTVTLQWYERRNNVLREHVGEVATLTNAWYNQLYEIRVAAHRTQDKGEVERLLDFYLQNRLVLPKLIMSLGVLKRSGAAEDLVAEVELFLTAVTDYQADHLNQDVFRCLPIDCMEPTVRRTALLDGTLSGSNLTRLGLVSELDALLLRLDQHQQVISNKASELLL